MIDLGRLGYAAAHDVQKQHHAEVLAAREAGSPDASRLLLVEHDPVITVTRRAAAAGHVLASAERLAELGIERVETDRGGDVTYHGPGQVVCYPILDLKHYGFRIHDYMRFLEQAVIDAIAEWGLHGVRDPEATGVWVETPRGLAKLCAMGVRIRRWVSLHGLALNVATDLSHFNEIVPCGLAGRPVTSLCELLGDSGPTVELAKRAISDRLVGALGVSDSAEPE